MLSALNHPVRSSVSKYLHNYIVQSYRVSEYLQCDGQNYFSNIFVTKEMISRLILGIKSLSKYLHMYIYFPNRGYILKDHARLKVS